MNPKPFSASIPSSFFDRDTVEVAQDLLGKILVREIDGELIGGRIVETEAYLGLEDPSCHSFHGKKTSRAEVFYMPASTIYVYLIYGMHYCLNFITGDHATPEAVLIRAVEPLFGLERMQKNRGPKPHRELCNGPAKLCKALEIDVRLNQQSLSQALYLTEPEVNEAIPIFESERVGLNPLMDSAYWPLRYYITDSPFISRP